MNWTFLNRGLALQKALHFNPTDGYAHYVLGRWCYQVASVGWLQRKAAAALFASPPESSYEQALEHFMKAETRESARVLVSISVFSYFYFYFFLKVI